MQNHKQNPSGANIASPTAAVLGQVGLPAPIADLASRAWDAVIVGAGHNGLTCAAYLARAGKRVLVLESRARVGGACTLEEPFPGVKMSPCAYLAGLLHPLVIEELSLAARGFEWIPAVNGLFVPFLDAPAFNSGMTTKPAKRRFYASLPKMSPAGKR